MHIYKVPLEALAGLGPVPDEDSPPEEREKFATSLRLVFGQADMSEYRVHFRAGGQSFGQFRPRGDATIESQRGTEVTVKWWTWSDQASMGVEFSNSDG